MPDLEVAPSMSDEEWTHRLGLFDGPTRMGSMAMGREKELDLPVLLRSMERDHDHAVERKAIFSAWDDVEIGLDPLIENSSDSTGPEALLIRKVVDGLGRSIRKGVVPDPSIVNVDPLIRFHGSWKKAPILVSNALGYLCYDPLLLSDAMMELNRAFPYHEPLLVPGSVDGINLEVLFYMGMEVFDDAGSILDASLGRYYTSSGWLDHRSIRDQGLWTISCRCDACRKMEEKEPEGIEAVRLLAQHNSIKLGERLELCRLHMLRGDLREHVLGAMRGKPEWMAALRCIETKGFPLIEQNTPAWRSVDRVLVTYRDDLYNPDFSLWRERLKKTYEPPPWKDILLLLPCSATKPYSCSPTHSRIYRALKGLKGWRDRVHRLVLTSPLGVVPMELEDLYPAAYYDIPVTGEWFPDEIGMIAEMMKTLLSKGKYNKVISFHPESHLFLKDMESRGKLMGIPYLDIFEDDDPHGVPASFKDEPADHYAALREALSKSTEQGPEVRPSYPGLVGDVLYSLEFLMSADLPQMNKPHVRKIRGRDHLMSGRDIIASLGKGGPQLTAFGGKLIWDHKSENNGRRVLIEDFKPRGTIFNQGIEKVEGAVNPGDQVLVGTGGKYKGVGRSLVPGTLMGTGTPGPAVKMVHRYKG